MLKLARLLVIACEEAIIDGGIPEEDAAVALISGRIGFASAADTMSQESWQTAVDACEQNVQARLVVKPEKVQ